MNVVRFLSPAGHVDLGPSALENLALACHRVAIGVADPGSREALARWQPLLEHESVLRGADRADFHAFFGSCWIGGAALGFKVSWRGWELDTLELSLNTALALGDGPLRLAARLAGLGPEQLWVAPADSSWLCDLVHRGLHLGLLPCDDGWRRVRALLADCGDDDSVVITHGPGARIRTPLSPATLAAHHFGEGLSVLDLLASDRASRLDRLLGVNPGDELIPRLTRSAS